MRTIKVKELEIPADIIIDVSNILEEKEIKNQLRGGDANDGTVFLDVQYEKGDEQAKGALDMIDELMDNYESEQDNEEEEDNQ